MDEIKKEIYSGTTSQATKDKKRLARLIVLSRNNLGQYLDYQSKLLQLLEGDTDKARHWVRWAERHTPTNNMY